MHLVIPTRAWLATAVAVVLAWPLVAQEATSRLIAVDFQVFDAEGRFVEGLTPADLELRINGRRREVKFVRQIAAAPSTAPDTDLPRPYGTSADSASGRTLLFVFDEDSFRSGREQPIRNAVSGLLSGLLPSDFVSVATMPYGGVKVPLTNDHTRVRHFFDTISGKRATGETGSQMACRTRLVLESLEHLLRSLGGRSTPMTVVLLTAGMAGPRRDAPMAMAPGMCELQSEAFRRVASAAGAARANFYIAQPDDTARSPDAAQPTGGAVLVESIGGTGFTGSDSPLAGIEDLAGTTNGVRLPLTALGTHALDRITRESSTYYLADIDSVLSDFDPRSQRLDLRVNRPGVTVRVRPEISFARPRVAAAGRVTVSDMLLSMATFADLPLRTMAYTMAAPDGLVQVVIVAEPEPRSTPLTSAGAVLVDHEGTVVARWNAVDAGESPLVGAMRVKAGSYRLRTAAVDAAGRGGAADYRFDATLSRVGPLSLGSVVLGLSREGRLLPRLEFSTEPSALASFEIYGGAEGMAITAALEIAKTADGPPLFLVPLAVQAGEGRHVAMGTVPIGALPPGDYAVRGVVRIEGGPTGRTTRTLRKVR